MKLPTYIKIYGLKDGAPCSNLFATVTLRTFHKNDFRISVGPTDQFGEMTVTREEMEQSIYWNTSTFPMDYTGIKDLTGEIVAQPKNRERLIGALAAYKMLGASCFPPNFAVDITASMQFLDEASPAELSVRIVHDGEGVSIRTESAQA